eukprot:SM000049S16683  [mRNA]  locus=s49:45544:47832:+ [translate_table: standard]
MSQSALHLGAASGHDDVVQLLLEWRGAASADLEARNMYGETPLHLAAKNGCLGVVRRLLGAGASTEARATNGMTPLHLAVWAAARSNDAVVVEELLEHHANVDARDNENKTPAAHLPKSPSAEQLQALLAAHSAAAGCISPPPPPPLSTLAAGCAEPRAVMEALEAELATLVGLGSLKRQLRSWAKGALLDGRRAALGLLGTDRTGGGGYSRGPPPHMALLGSPGTGKTTVARIVARLLHALGALPTDCVIECQRTDLVGEFVGHTGPKTRKKARSNKIQEAEGGVLFVDEAYRLVPAQKADEKDYGIEALEEIMAVMDSGRLVVIFAEIAEVMLRKMTDTSGLLQGFHLATDCTPVALTALLERKTTARQRRQRNGGLALPVLCDARDMLDCRLDLDCADAEELVTLRLADFEAALELVAE